MASQAGRRRSLSNDRRVLLVTLIVVAIFVAYVVFQNLPSSGQIVQNWQLKMTFHDSKTGQNFYPPAGIGMQGGYWANHTLDRFGPPGFAPIFTRDGSGTIYIESNYPAIFTFEDFFNIWGVTFTDTCIWNYCGAPAELLVYDADNNTIYDAGERVINPVNGVGPTLGAQLSNDPNIKFWDSNGNGFWDTNETVVYDLNGSGVYQSNDTIIFGTATPSPGTKLTFDPKLRFVDSNSNKVWDNEVPPPGMSDGDGNQGCIQNYALSNLKNWTILVNDLNWAQQNHCLVPNP